MKKVKLINSQFEDEFTEKETEVNSKKVWRIDTSVLESDNMIILIDENNNTIREMLIPVDMLVIIDYLD